MIIYFQLNTKVKESNYRNNFKTFIIKYKIQEPNRMGVQNPLRSKINTFIFNQKQIFKEIS